MPSSSPSEQILWQRARARLPQLPEIERILNAAQSPAQIDAFAKMIARETEAQEAMTQFLGEVDSGDEALTDWLEAMVAFDECLRTTAHRPTLTQATGYLSCCSTAIESGVRYADFPATVRTFFETYGYHPESAH